MPFRCDRVRYARRRADVRDPLDEFQSRTLQEATDQHARETRRTADPRDRRIGNDRLATCRTAAGARHRRRPCLRPRRDQAVLPASAASWAKRPPFPDRRHPRPRPSPAGDGGHRPRLPLRGAQARRIRGIQPVRGHPDQRRRHPERHRRVPGGRCRDDDPDVVGQGGQPDLRHGRLQAARREAGECRDQLPRPAPHDVRQRPLRERPGFARVGAGVVRPAGRGGRAGDRHRPVDDPLRDDDRPSGRPGHPGRCGRPRRRGLRVQDAGRPAQRPGLGDHRARGARRPGSTPPRSPPRRWPRAPARRPTRN